MALLRLCFVVMRSLKGQRVWLFVAHGKQTRMQNHEAELVQAAEAIGLQIDRVHAIGVAAYVCRVAL